ncbi:MAG TPA: potassium-transporting ATPase subunit C [Nitrososphaeraceae archaeon]|nr:potassium-transporting ATPase subunit C [Nitrososphaeraceae archaeon]
MNNNNNKQTIRNFLFNNLPPSIRIVLLMMLVTGIGYPVSLIIIGEIALPYQSEGSQMVWNDKVIGSKLIAQEFTSSKFFHSRPATDSASTVDPHITPESAYQQIANVSKATGIPENALKTLVDLNIERNKVSNLVIFAPKYVNVLEVNLELVKQYPEIYSVLTTELLKKPNIS